MIILTLSIRKMVRQVGIEPTVFGLKARCYTLSASGASGGVGGNRTRYGFRAREARYLNIRPRYGGQGWNSHHHSRRRRFYRPLGSLVPSLPILAESSGLDPQRLAPPDGLANRACRPAGLHSISGGGLRSRTPNLSVPLVFKTSRRPTQPNPPDSGHRGQIRTGVLRFAGGCVASSLPGVILVPSRGIEPRTSCLQGRRSAN